MTYKTDQTITAGRNGVEWECVIKNVEQVTREYVQTLVKSLGPCAACAVPPGEHILAYSTIDGAEILFRNGESKDGVRIIKKE